jgi:hypothetical protein
MTKLSLYSVVTAAMAAAVTAGTASASTRLYNKYACTLQGTVGLTYIIESSSATTIQGICPVLKKVLGQTQLRWGLHPPSVSSGETASATWISTRLKTKINMLARQLPALPALIRAVGRVLSPAIWHRSAISYP